MDKLSLIILMFIFTPDVFACGGEYFDPDGKNVFFYEEYLHMNRGKFTDELHQKCAEYSKKQMIKHNMI